MAIVVSENFDSVTPPALPAAMTFDASSWETSATAAHSAPNAAKTTATGLKFAYTNVKDGAGGNARARADFFVTTFGGSESASVIVRSSAQSNTNYGQATVFPASFAIRKVTGGAGALPTGAADVPFTPPTNVWLRITIEFLETTIRGKLQRLDNNQFLQTNGTWAATEVWAASGTNTQVVGEGYGGLRVNTGTVGRVTVDNFVLESIPMPDLTVTKGDGTALADAGTDAVGNLRHGKTEHRRYVLTNSGFATVTISGVTLSGGLTQVTSVTNGTTLTAGASVEFIVSINTASLGAVSETISIASNDSTTPYNWTLSGTVSTRGILTGEFASHPTWIWTIDSNFGGPSAPNAKENNCRTKHTWSQSGSTVRVAYANTKINGVDGELSTSSNITIHAAVLEYPTGVYHALTFGGSASVTLAAGEMQQSDPVAISVVAGQIFWDRVNVESAGTVFHLNGIAHSATGEGFTNTQVDETQNASAAWGPLHASNPYGFHHVAITVETITGTREPIVGIIGDSISGYVSTSMDLLGIKRLFMGMSGESVAGFLGSANSGFGSPVRQSLGRHCDFLVDEFGVNDARLLRPATAIQNSQIETARRMGVDGAVVYITTLTPLTQSSDNWATLVNQTEGIYSWAIRTAYNTWVRAGQTANGIAAYFEAGDLVASSAGANTWGVPDWTDDGVHPNATGYARLQPEAFGDGSAFDLPPDTAPNLTVTGVAHNGTDARGDISPNQTRIYTITNDGNLDLELISVTIDGDGVELETTFPNGYVLAPTESTTFTIEFTDIGAISAEITITSNDDPYIFTVTANVRFFKDPSLFPGLALRYDLYTQSLVDVTGTGNNLTLGTNAPTFVPDGLLFDGVNDYCVVPIIPNETGLHPARITIFAVFNSDSSTGQQTVLRLIDPTTANWISFNNRYDNVTYWDYGNVSSGRINAAAPAGMFNDLVSVVCRVSGTASALLVDGTSVISGTVTNAFTASSSLRNLYVGCASPGDAHFKGTLVALLLFTSDLSNDDVAHLIGHYKRVLAEKAIPADLNVGTSASATAYNVLPEPIGSYADLVATKSPLHYVPLDEVVGATNVKDFGSANAGGDVAGTITFGQTGALRGSSRTAAKFNGYVNFENPEALRVTGAFTMHIWVTLHAWPTGDGDIRFFAGWGFDVGNNARAYLRIMRVGGNFLLQFGSYNGANHIAEWQVDNRWALGVRHLIVGVYTGAAWNLYFDGQLIDTTIDATGPIAAGIGRLAIGGEDVQGTFGRFANATFDEFILDDSAWSAADALAFFNAGDRYQLADKQAIFNDLGLVITFGFAENTFLEQELPDGTANPSVVDPTDFDADQWMELATAAGARGVTIETKHVGGMCMWNTATTAYKTSVDYVDLAVTAARNKGLYVILYFSMWDSNWETANPGFTSAEVTAFVISQLDELCSMFDPDALLTDCWKWRATTGYDVVIWEEVYEWLKVNYPNVLLVENGHENAQNGDLVHLTHSDVGLWEYAVDGDVPVGNNLPAAMMWQTIWEDVDGVTGWPRWFHNSANSTLMSLEEIQAAKTLTNSRNAVYNLNVTIDQTGQVPFAQAEILRGNTLVGKLISYWPLDEAGGTRNDAHSTNHLTDVNTVGFAIGKKGSAASFVSANSESLTRASNANLQIGNNSFTYAFWVWMANLSHVHTFISKDKDTGREFALDISGSFRMYLNGAASGTVTSTVTPAAETWYFLLFERDVVTNKIAVEVNNAIRTEAAGSTASFATATELRFGANSYPGFESYGDIIMDEVVYAKALFTPAEKAYLYNKGLGRSYIDLAEYSAGSRIEQRNTIGIGIGV